MKTCDETIEKNSCGIFALLCWTWFNHCQIRFKII